MVKHSRDAAWLAGFVYFTQGALGISGVALPLYMRKLGWSISEIMTIASVAALPWVLKVFYGLLSDCFPLFGYRRKPYLILFALVSAFGWLSLILFPSVKGWILFSLILTNLGFAATDVIVDGFVVEHSRGFTSHLYQSIAWGSRSFGAILGGVTGGWLAGHWQAKEVFFVTMLLPLPVILIALRITEPKMPRGPFHSLLEPLKRCFNLLIIPNLRWFTLLLLVTTVSSLYGVPFFFFMKETLGFRETFLGFLGSWGWFGAVCGSFLYGRWLSRISPKVILLWAILANSLNSLGALFVLDNQSAIILVFIGGMMNCLTILPIVSVAAMLTHHSAVESSLFAILMSVFNVGQIFFGFLGGRLYNFMDLRSLILISSFLSLTGLIIVQRLKFQPSGAPG